MSADFILRTGEDLKAGAALFETARWGREHLVRTGCIHPSRLSDSWPNNPAH